MYVFFCLLLLLCFFFCTLRFAADLAEPRSLAFALPLSFRAATVCSISACCALGGGVGGGLCIATVNDRLSLRSYGHLSHLVLPASRERKENSSSGSGSAVRRTNGQAKAAFSRVSRSLFLLLCVAMLGRRLF